MVPASITEQLAALRRLERRLRLTWGLARLVAVASAVMILACAADWWLDLERDTPWALRIAVFITQLGLWAACVYSLLLLPFFRRMGDEDLALWVEKRLPIFGHRLISAVQLNQPDADTRGMSPEMIAAVTREAEERVQGSFLLGLPDRRRLRWSLAFGIATLLLLGITWLILGRAFPVLLGRQFLADWAIPKSVAIRDLSKKPWPSGEAGLLAFEVTSENDLTDFPGYVEIQPLGRPTEKYPFRQFLDAPGKGPAAFHGEIPPGATAFRYRARVRDGRSSWSDVTYVPRPAVKKQEAWVQLPAYCGTRPDGRPYEQPQPRGEIVGVQGAKARIVIETDTLVSRATLVLLHRTASELRDAGGRETVGLEVPSREIELELHDDGRSAAVIFDLKPEETAYRIVVRDEHGFTNARPARRSISVTPDETPQVILLPERFAPAGEQGLAEDVEVENMPLPLGEAVQVGFYCRDTLGLDRAELRYRINTGPWRRFPLRENAGESHLGHFDPRRGLFAKSGERDQVFFHAIPSPVPDLSPGRLEGGGRFDFQTRGIPGLKIGDHLEFYVEVYDRNPELDREPGRSETRVKTIVTQQQFKDWVYRTLQHERRIRELEQKQRGVFERPEKP